MIELIMNLQCICTHDCLRNVIVVIIIMFGLCCICSHK